MKEIEPKQYEIIENGVCAPGGFQASGVACGIKKTGLKDMAIIRSDNAAKGAALYTSNRFQAAPIHITREHLLDGKARAVVVNSGNANACTGASGLDDARKMTRLAAEATGINEIDVMVASTGVIGTYLPMDRIHAGISDAAEQLSAGGSSAAAEAILTTDTFRKEWAVAGEVGAKRFSVGGMAKGAGMIRPDLATMLAFVTTDAQVDPETLLVSLTRAVNASFNMISVDGCMSTNDMVLAMANGASGASITDEEEAKQLTGALTAVCRELARMIVRDAEGATKFVTVNVRGGADFREAKAAAMAVADSNLVKTAIFGQDANWGRVAAALGAAGIAFNPERVDIYLGAHLLVADGEPIAADEAKLARYMKEADLEIRVNLNRGPEEATVWTSDLSYDYVRINADYRS